MTLNIRAFPPLSFHSETGATKKFASLENRFRVSELIAMAVGGVLAAVLSIGGMTLVPSVALAAWHVIWCAVFYFISKKSLRLDE